MNGIFSFLKGFPSWVIVLVSFLLFGLLFFIFVRIFKSIAFFFGSIKKHISDLLGDLTGGFIGTDEEQQNIDKSVEDYLKKQASESADELPATLKEGVIGEIAENLYYSLLANSDEDLNLLYSSLNLLGNRTDWALVKEKFGVRDDNGWWKSFRGTLVQAMYEYLNEKELNECKKILSSKNILEL